MLVLSVVGNIPVDIETPLVTSSIMLLGAHVCARLRCTMYFGKPTGSSRSAIPRARSDGPTISFFFSFSKILCGPHKWLRSTPTVWQK
jgi:hypothetical protein